MALLLSHLIFPHPLLPSPVAPALQNKDASSSYALLNAAYYARAYPSAADAVQKVWNYWDVRGRNDATTGRWKGVGGIRWRQGLVFHTSPLPHFLTP